MGTLMNFVAVILLYSTCAMGLCNTNAPLQVLFIENGMGHVDKKWEKYGLNDFLRTNDIVGRSVNGKRFFSGKATEDEILRELKKYHVVIPSIPRGFREADYRALTEAFRNALLRYVQDGGGLLILAAQGEYLTDRRPQIFNLLYDKIGLKMTEEGICDRKREYQYLNHPKLSRSDDRTPSYLRFFYTDNIMPSPLTNGISRIYFPQWGAGGMWGSILLKYSGDWEIVIRGEDSAMSYLPDKHFTKNGPYTQVGQCKGAAPLAGWRDYGKGRIVAYSCSPMHLLYNPKAAGWPGIHEYAGDTERKSPSGGNQFLLNALRFVAENAKKHSDSSTHFQTVGSSARLKSSIVDYSRKNFPKIPTKPQMRGVIGVHSNLSDGRSTPEELIQAAKSAGLNFLVFCESAEKIDAKKFEQLKKLCVRNSDSGFYVCPGLEFSESSGLRWVIWGEAVVYPPPQLWAADGKSIQWRGQYVALCDRRPNGIINYRKLATIGNLSNLWWYYRLPYQVWRDGKFQEENFEEYLETLADIRGVGIYIYSGLYDHRKMPELISKAGTTVVPGEMKEVKSYLNSKNIQSSDKAYVTQGPVILDWQAINPTEGIFNQTDGSQLARCRFAVDSENGIREIRIYSAGEGLFRMFDGSGEKRVEQEFSLTHDRMRTLVAEIIDMKGRKAISGALKIRQPLYNIGRCTDNLNLLGLSTLTSHPDRHEYQIFRNFEDDAGDTKSCRIVGIDSSSGFEFQPNCVLSLSIHAGNDEQLSIDKDREVRNAMGSVYPFSSPGISMIVGESKYRVDTSKRHYPERRQSFSQGPFYLRSGAQPLADIQINSYLLRSRIDPSLRWSRPWEATKNYRGGVMLHEIEFCFKKDVVLSGDIPIEICRLQPGGGQDVNESKGYWDRLLVKTPDGIMNTEKVALSSGVLADGGYVTISSTSSPRRIILLASAPNGEIIRFKSDATGVLTLGIGSPGEKIRAGTCLKMNLAVVTDAVGENGNIDPEALSIYYDFKKSGGFYKVELQNHAGWITLPPQESVLICDGAFRIGGVQNNGVAAYYEDYGAERFLFAPVYKEEMFFQSNIDAGAKIWVGNIFISDNKDLQITLLNPDTLEIHNPTDKAVAAKLYSPLGTPHYGGKMLSVNVPAKSSVILKIK